MTTIEIKLSQKTIDKVERIASIYKTSNKTEILVEGINLLTLLTDSLLKGKNVYIEDQKHKMIRMRK